MPQVQPEGFLATPPTGSGRGVLVLHPWWGLNETIKSVCTRLADSGFVAFAPDLYHGKIARTIADAESCAGALDHKQAKADVADSVAFLRERAGLTPSGLAVIGFSLGAFFAIDVSVADPDDVHSVVLFYGSGPGDFSRSKAEYLGHFAETDPYEPQVEVDGLEAALRGAGRKVSFFRYPGTGHWFFEPDREDAFHPEAAKLAWERTLTFLRGQTPS